MGDSCIPVGITKQPACGTSWKSGSGELQGSDQGTRPATEDEPETFSSERARDKDREQDCSGGYE